MPVNLPNLTMQVASYFYPILSRYITGFCAFLCRFYSIYCVVILHLPAVFVIHLYVFLLFLGHAVNHFHNVVVGFAFLSSRKYLSYTHLLESFYFNLIYKLTQWTIKAQKFQAIYYKVLKHERSLSVTEAPWICLPFWPPFVPVNLLTVTTQVLHFSCSLFYPISSRYLTILVHFYVVSTLFFVLLYFFISQRFSFYTSTIFLWHAVSHSYNVMVSFAFFVFVRHTAHCFLLLVSCML